MSGRYLVTGCAGFIGARVTQMLLADGRTVIGIDNLNDAYDTRLKDWRLARLAESDDFTFIELDISERDGLGDIGDPPLDGVLNLAARAGVRQSVEDPWIYFEANLWGVLNLLELCRRTGVGKFVQASTSSIYGNQDEGPFREDTAPAPISPYAASKKAAEDLCYTYHRLHGLDVTVLRYFTVYGPAGRPDMSIFRFVKWIAEGHPVTVYGDGGQNRDFTYVDDVARGTLSALDCPGYEIVNLGSSRPVVLMDAIKMIEGAVGREAILEYSPVHAADAHSTWADNSKAERLFGWCPETTLEEGVNLVVDWYLENREWARSIDTG